VRGGSSESLRGPELIEVVGRGAARGVSEACEAAVQNRCKRKWAIAIKYATGTTATMKDMNTAVDTFHRFVGVVQATLDDPDVAGTDVADRAHMSRFYFDRVIPLSPGRPRGSSVVACCWSVPPTGS
jgi:hypothetical protein